MHKINFHLSTLGRRFGRDAIADVVSLQSLLTHRKMPLNEGKRRRAHDENVCQKELRLSAQIIIIFINAHNVSNVDLDLIYWQRTVVITLLVNWIEAT